MTPHLRYTRAASSERVISIVHTLCGTTKGTFETDTDGHPVTVHITLERCYRATVTHTADTTGDVVAAACLVGLGLSQRLRTQKYCFIKTIVCVQPLAVFRTGSRCKLSATPDIEMEKYSEREGAEAGP